MDDATLCSVDGCGRRLKAVGACASHYEHQRAGRSATEIRPYLGLTALDRRLRRTYSMTEAQYFARLAAQGGVCAICRKGSGNQMSVDHDHACCPGSRSCGECVRGLLCKPCNSFLGRINDQPERVVSYLAGR